MGRNASLTGSPNIRTPSLNNVIHAENVPKSLPVPRHAVRDQRIKGYRHQAPGIEYFLTEIFPPLTTIVKTRDRSNRYWNIMMVARPPAWGCSSALRPAESRIRSDIVAEASGERRSGSRPVGDVRCHFVWLASGKPCGTVDGCEVGLAHH